jgi:uncharacterized peroxidase-related enzyme
VEQLVAEWRMATISESDRVMLTYVEKLTLCPWTITETDVVALRTAGFSDAAILDINQVTAYYAYVNRLADGLGVNLEQFWAGEETSNG